MSRWFYAGWASLVGLALVLPVALAYAIWSPPDTGRGSWTGPADAEMFGRWPRTQIEGTRFIPTSVEVEAGPLLRAPVPCDGPSAMHRLPRVYTAKVTLRGAYGIPLTSFEVTCSGWNRIGRSEGESLALVLGALLATVGLVSTPFAFFWLRQTFKKQQRFAV